MSTLSLCVICKNEEKNIKRLLDSIKGDLFDEIIICDTGSEDKTIEIAKSYDKVKIEHFPWINDFSAARNYSFSKATCSEIMWVDADDIIRPIDYKKLLALKPRLNEANMWLLKYEYAHDDQGNSICSFYRERIIKRSLNIQWQEPIHEYLPLTGTMKKEDIEIHHYKAHNSSPRNIPMLEDIVAKNPNNARNVFYLGKEYFDNGQPDKGFEMLTKFVGMPEAWVENKYAAYIRLGDYFYIKREYPKSREYFFKAIECLPLKADAYCKMADSYFNENDWVNSEHWYKIASNMEKPDLLDIIEPKYFTWLPSLQLCLVYNNLGKIYEAAVANEKALSFLPNDTRVLSNKKIFENALKDKYPYKSKTIVSERPKGRDLSKVITFSGKLGWLVPPYYDSGTIRIRTLNIAKKLKEMGYVSEICIRENALNYDIIVVGKSFQNDDLQYIKTLKSNNKYVICDLSEDIVNWVGVSEIIKECNAVICCSEALKQKVLNINSNAFVIEDAVEYSV